MHRNLEYEQEINLKSLFFSLMYRWRSILVAALIGAVILGAFQYLFLSIVHSKGELTEEERQYEIELQKYHTAMEIYHKDIESLTNLIAAQQEYYDNSPYLKLDPQNVWIAERRYSVEVDPRIMEALPEGNIVDPTDYVLSVYAAAMRESLDDAELEEVFGTTNLTYISELAWISTNAGDNTLSLAGRSTTPEDAERLLSYVVSRVEQLNDKAQNIEPHKLVLYNENVASRSDFGVLTARNNTKNEIYGYQRSLDAAYEGLTNLEIEEEPEPPGNHIKKMAAIGFILGAFLLAGVYAAMYILSGKLVDSDMLSSQYGIPILGELYRSQAKHSGKWPDSWIEAMERGKTIQDNSNVIGQITELIQAQAPDGSILLVSTGKEERLTEFVKQLSGNFKGRDIKCCADFLSNGGAVSAASKADAVIVVEEKNASYLKNIDRMADLLITSQAKVIGAIVL